MIRHIVWNPCSISRRSGRFSTRSCWEKESTSPVRSLDEDNEQNQKELYARQYTHITGSSHNAGCGHQLKGQVLPEPPIRNWLQDWGDNRSQEEGLRPDNAASEAHNNRQDRLEEGTALMSVSLTVTYLNTIKDLKDGQIIWRQIGSSKDKDKPMTDDSARKLLRVIGHRAGITKPINLHAFRKAGASHLANKLSDQQLRVYFGWLPSSNMVDYYIRVSNTALDNAHMEINGIEVKKEAYQAMLKPNMCIRCSFSNSPDMQFCGRCGSTLDTQTAIQMDEDRKNIDNALNAYIKSSDPKALKEELSHIILKLDRMQKTKRR